MIYRNIRFAGFGILLAGMAPTKNGRRVSRPVITLVLLLEYPQIGRAVFQGDVLCVARDEVWHWWCWGWWRGSSPLHRQALLRSLPQNITFQPVAPRMSIVTYR